MLYRTPCDLQHYLVLLNKACWQIIYHKWSKTNCCEILPLIYVLVVSFPKSNMRCWKNPPPFTVPINFGDLSLSWLVARLCQFCPWDGYLVDHPSEKPTSHQAQADPGRLWSPGRSGRLANLFGFDLRWPAGIIRVETQRLAWEEFLNLAWGRGCSILLLCMGILENDLMYM